MSTFNHVQEAKKRITLPQVENVGVCLTCSYWDAETPRLPDGMLEKDGITTVRVTGEWSKRMQ